MIHPVLSTNPPLVLLVLSFPLTSLQTGFGVAAGVAHVRGRPLFNCVNLLRFSMQR